MPGTALTDVIGRAAGGGTGMALDPQWRPPMTASRKTSETSAPARKIDQVLALLHRKQGATAAEIAALTAWLPHTARAALTGLRKKGHVITKTKRDDANCYRITGQA
ncbi:DUF3489 domain-containing protein [Erythrobacter sp. SG61-1L]|uniref:DUF3489 domain-containing protein n=1 Tax=Erythrobacter sp. SG61-1L TaxID=1603897 RepID=UPI0006C93ACB|nr:DUF3489 domain-containing protein [Erythrobacter sp. SG61-1L]